MRKASIVLAAGGALAAALFAVSPARADITHVVQRGHTIEAIAHRYHVSVKSILDANHLKDAKHLHPGQTLVIPGVNAKGGASGDAKDHGTKPPKKGDKDKSDGATHTPAPRTASLETQPEPRGRAEDATVHAVRMGEEFRIHVKDHRGHIPESTLQAFERMMRQGNATHSVDPRLVALVGIVSSHFGGKPIEVVSGYRAYTPTQYTPHSNHNLGKALDFRIRGVSNESLRDFCRTLRNAGCGYYPNSSFVHLDVRDTKAFWVDWSHPGEPPKYDKPDVEADEGTSDVPEATPLDTDGSSNTQPTPADDSAPK
jgi:uncharacterized protein YcbK (DUF882 family)